MEDTNREEQNGVYEYRRTEWIKWIEKNRIEYTEEKNRLQYKNREEYNEVYRYKRIKWSIQIEKNKCSIRIEKKRIEYTDKLE